MEPSRFDDAPRAPLCLSSIVWVGATIAAGALVWLVAAASARSPRLPVLVQERMDPEGIANPVTAVVLDFRGYDTLLEMAALAVAMVGVWSLDRGGGRFGREPGEERAEPVLLALSRLVVPLAAVVGTYLLWIGSRAPGGAFQAGAVLAGAGVLLLTAGFLLPPTASARIVRGLMAIGLLVFAAVGIVMLPVTGSFMDYPAGWTPWVVLLVEVGLTITVTSVLMELVVDVPAVPEHDPALASVDPTGDPLGRALRLDRQRVVEAAAMEADPGRGQASRPREDCP